MSSPGPAVAAWSRAVKSALLALPCALFIGLGCTGNNSDPAPQASLQSRPPAVSVKTPATDPASGPGYFDDVTAVSGLAFTYRNGEEANRYSILESLGGGVALIDYDRDGLLDIFVTGGGYFDPKTGAIRGHPNRLFRNEGNWHFRDVTAEVGLPTEGVFYSHGCGVGDYDNDGWPDLLVTGYGRLALYRNNHGRFEDVTENAKLWPDNRPVHWSTSAAWVDFDGDGLLDLYICHYVDWSPQNDPRCKGYGPDVPVDVCPPNRFNPLLPQLFRNNGDGTFRDVTREAGLKPGKALGVLAVDLNDDGRPEIYVANDAIEKHLYVNLGGGKFAESAATWGVSGSEQGLPDGSMGVDAADYNGAGRFSLFVTNYQRQVHALYCNEGRQLFRHVSSRVGIAALGRTFVGFGGGFLDFDLDGNEDLFISHGHVVRHPIPPTTLTQRAVLLRNLRQPGISPRDVRFEDVSAHAGPYFHTAHRGRGVAFGDLDNDGRIDIVLNPCNEPVTLLRNRVGGGHHWLGIKLVGRPNPDAVGAKLVLEVGDQKLARAVKGGASYLSANDSRVVFGLGDATGVGRLSVRWPWGQTQSWDGLAIDRYWTLIQGDAEPHQGQPVAPRREE